MHILQKYQKAYVLLYLYVDEMLNQTKNMLKGNFEMKDMVVDVTLGIKVTKKSNGIILTQSNYTQTILERFNHYSNGTAKTLLYRSLSSLKKNSGKVVS